MKRRALVLPALALFTFAFLLHLTKFAAKVEPKPKLKIIKKVQVSKKLLNASSANEDAIFLAAKRQIRKELGRESMETFSQPKRAMVITVLSCSKIGRNEFVLQIITTWRSGSTFFGDILKVHPATFYHYEPLIHTGIRQVKGPKKTEEALSLLKSLFLCNYTTGFGKKHHIS